MLRVFAVILLTLGLPFSAMAQGMRPMNEVTIVALILTSEGETPVSISVTETLESLDAQTLTANAPNASEMRSILKRFAAAAIDTDIALVYFDGAVLKLGERDFVAPGGIELDRRTDLLTKAIPLSAFARATALAGQGGAVLVHSSGQNINLLEGVTLVETAPAPRPGTSPVLFAATSAATRLSDGLKAMSAVDGDIDLTEALRGLAELEGLSISQMPTRSVMLRILPVPEPVVTAPPVEPPTETPIDDTATVEETVSALPQVGDTDETPVSADPTADTTDTDQTATAQDAPAEPAGNDDVDQVETTLVETVVEPVVEPAEQVLSLDVLRAMQGAVSRSQKRVIQRNLRAQGFYRGLIDGIFGRQTDAAISAYQASIEAATTGVLTPAQLEALSN